MPLLMSQQMSLVLTFHLANWLTSFTLTSWYTGNTTSGHSSIHLPMHKSSVRNWACTYTVLSVKSKVERHAVTPFSTLLYLMLGSISFMLILWDLYHLQCVSFTCSPVWNISYVGRKHFHLQMSVARPLVDNGFVTGWVAHYGVHSFITTDQGWQFKSHPCCQIVQLLGTKQIRTTACHQIVNLLAECFHYQLKVALKCQCIPKR